MSKAELLHQLDQYPDARWVGKVRADVNMSGLIGGLSRIKGRTEPQVQGAAAFRSVAERAQLGATRAIDYGAPRVDTSGPTAAAVVDTGEDARRDYARARAALGIGSKRLALAEAIIVQGASVSEVADRLGFGRGGTGREKATHLVLDAADELARVFKFSGGRAPRRPPSAAPR